MGKSAEQKTDCGVVIDGTEAHGTGLLTRVAELHRVVASLRIVGDAPDSDRISALLGCKPTKGWARGDVIKRGKLPDRVATFGLWSLEASETQPADLDLQVDEIIERTSNDLRRWAEVGAAFEVSLFCGWFMEAWNEGTSLAPRTLEALAVRGIALDIDLYGPSDDDPE